jgi:hypothetical protein
MPLRAAPDIRSPLVEGAIRSAGLKASKKEIAENHKSERVGTEVAAQPIFEHALFEGFRLRLTCDMIGAVTRLRPDAKSITPFRKVKA